MISEQVFFHGWFYPFRIHEEKNTLLCPHPLQQFLHNAMTNCPHEYFQQGPRSSRLKFALPFPTTPLHGHEVSHLAATALECSPDKTPHAKVQNFMLEQDDKTIAIEVPLWMTPEEMAPYFSFFGTHAPLTGHIDVLRIEDGHIWIWDFKPHAHKEKYAHTQVYSYALMLSLRTSIPLNDFYCGYFDEQLAYIFRPSYQSFLPKSADSLFK